MTVSVQILIHGVDVSNFVMFDTVNVDNNIVMTSDTMNFSLIVLPSDSFSVPRCGQEVIWQNPSTIIKAPDGSMQPFREFGGIITEVDETNVGNALQYDISCNSYTHWLDRHLVTNWYNQDSPENIIRKIQNQYAKPFTTYNVQSTNVTVVPQYFDHTKVSNAIQNIADQIEYGWFVDYYKDINFFTIQNNVSPLPNNTLNPDVDIENYGDLILKENAQQQMNKVFIKGFKTRSADIHLLTFLGDSSTTQWSLGYRVSSVKGDVVAVVYDSMAAYQADTQFQSGGTPTGGTTMKIAQDIVDGAPNQKSSSNTCFIHYTQHLARLPNYGGTNAPLASGKVLAIRFHYLTDMVWLAQDPVAQNNTAKIEGTDGVYEDVYQDKSLTNSTLDAVKAKGELLLQRYKYPQMSGEFTTYFNNTTTKGWLAGQHFTLKSSLRFGGVNKTFFVQRVTKTIVKHDSKGLITLYNIEFADTPYAV